MAQSGHIQPRPASGQHLSQPRPQPHLGRRAAQYKLTRHAHASTKPTPRRWASCSRCSRPCCRTHLERPIPQNVHVCGHLPQLGRVVRLQVDDGSCKRGRVAWQGSAGGSAGGLVGGGWLGMEHTHGHVGPCTPMHGHGRPCMSHGCPCEPCMPGTHGAHPCMWHAPPCMSHAHPWAPMRAHAWPSRLTDAHAVLHVRRDAHALVVQQLQKLGLHVQRHPLGGVRRAWGKGCAWRGRGTGARCVPWLPALQENQCYSALTSI